MTNIRIPILLVMVVSACQNQMAREPKDTVNASPNTGKPPLAENNEENVLAQSMVKKFLNHYDVFDSYYDQSLKTNKGEFIIIEESYPYNNVFFTIIKAKPDGFYQLEANRILLNDNSSIEHQECSYPSPAQVGYMYKDCYTKSTYDKLLQHIDTFSSATVLVGIEAKSKCGECICVMLFKNGKFTFYRIEDSNKYHIEYTNILRFPKYFKNFVTGPLNWKNRKYY